MAIHIQLVKRRLRSKRRNGQHDYRWVMRWYDPATGERRCESTGTADKTQADEMARVRWAELNIPGVAPELETELVEPVAAPTWQECREAMERAQTADNVRPSYTADCLIVLESVRRRFPAVLSPADVTPEMANEYKRLRSEAVPTPSPWTVRGDLATLKAIFGKWLGAECGLLTSNPFANVKPPKCDDPDVRIVSAQETRELFTWMADRWNNWRLPATYLQVAALVGWRASELASMRDDDVLADGFIRVTAGKSKTRKQKFAWLPADLHAELQDCAANGWVFGRFSDELLRLLMLWKRRPHHAAKVRDFAPERLVGWLQDELQRFCEHRQTVENEAAAKAQRQPEAIPAFTLHDFRRTAITGMQMAGVSEKEASVQVGCTPEVMRRHYERLDGMAIARRNGQRRLGASSAESEQVHANRRAGDARPDSKALDHSGIDTQTVVA